MAEAGDLCIFEAPVQPEVITQDLLITLVVNQGPKEEASKYSHQEGIKFDKVLEIRIEFLSIISCTFKNLTINH